MSELILTRKIKTVCLTCGAEVYAQITDNLLEVDRCRPCVSKRVRRIKGGVTRGNFIKLLEEQMEKTDEEAKKYWNKLIFTGKED